MKRPILVKIKIDDKSASRALLNCLAPVPFIRLSSSRPLDKPGAPDLEAKFRIGNRSATLIAEVKASGEPRLARNAANQLRSWLQNRKGAYGIFIAPYISPESAGICLDAGLGYLDLAGNCYLSFDRVFIQRQGYPNPTVAKRQLRSLYSPKAERVLRVLLGQPNQSWRTEALATAADVSLGQIARVTRRLVDAEWLAKDPRGFRLTNPRALLDDWSQQYRFQRSRTREYYVMSEVADIELQLAQQCKQRKTPYALTAFSAAARLAPMVRYQRVTAYVQAEPDQVAVDLRWKAVDSGANVTLAYPYDAGVFYEAQELDGVITTSPIQAFLDLQEIRGRGQEAAQAIRREIEKTWE